MRERAEELLTFEALIEEWSALHLAHRRRRYAEEAVRAIRSGLTTLLTRPAARITRSDAVNALDQLVSAGKVVTAGRTMAYARACFAWAEQRGKISANPFANLPISGTATERERVLTEAELAEIWAASGTLGYPFGPFYRIAMLTLQRRAEVAGMRWSEIAPDLSLWRIPGPRMKNGRPHDVHLSKAAKSILSALLRTEGCDLVFTTTGKTPISGFSKGKRYLDSAILRARAEETATLSILPAPLIPWRLHDFRRTGVTKLGSRIRQHRCRQTAGTPAGQAPWRCRGLPAT
jgi:integrase